MKMARAAVVVEGRVQGVFFRANTQEEAMRRGVKGWVRNNSDDTVEALFEGAEDAVTELIGWCHGGPPGAAVTKVRVQWEDFNDEFKEFSIVYGKH